MADIKRRHPPSSRVHQGEDRTSAELMPELIFAVSDWDTNRVQRKEESYQI